MFRRSALLAFTLLTVPLAAGAQEATHYAATFRVDGQVKHPTTYSLASLEQMASTKLDVDFYTGAGPVNAAYTGVLLWDLLNQAGLVTDAAVKNDILRKAVLVTGSDGYEAVFSLGEIAPQFGGEQVIVAYAKNGAPLSASTGFAEIVAPGDKAGGRAVNTITHITLLGWD